MPDLDSEMANQPSDLYSEPINENVSESDTCKPDVDIHFEPSSELIEYCDTEEPIDDQQKQDLQSLECPTSAQSDPIHDVLRPPEYHDRSLSPATRLRSQDLSYAEILALGLRKQAKAQNIISLPKPQVAEVEMVKEIVVEVEKAPPIIHCEPRVQPTDSSRIKPERPERPFQRSRSRDMPRQRRAPEKRSTKSHDMQIIKKKKTSRKVIEVENFDDSPEAIEPTTKSSDTSIYKTIEKFEEPKIEKSCKEITKKVHHSATVVETVIETVSEEVPQEPLKTELEQKKPKKKNKHKKVKEIDDEIEKALKEIEESDRHKKRKIKDSRDKSKEMIKGAESDETEQHAEVTKRSLEAMAGTKEVTNKQKKKKIHKDSKTSKHKEEKSETNIHLIQSTDEKPTTQSSNLGKEMLPIVESDDSDNYNLSERGDFSIIKNKKNNINENVSDVKSANKAIGNVGTIADKLYQNEMNTQSVTTSFTRTKEEHDDLKNEESDAEKASKQKKKKKGKKQGQSPEHSEHKLITTEVVKSTFEGNMKIIDPIDEKIPNVVNKTEESKPYKLVPFESSDSIKEKVHLGNTLDRSKPNDDVESIIPKKKLNSKKQKSTESKNTSQEQTLSEALGTAHVILEDKGVENVVEEEFTEVKTNKNKLRSKKLKGLEQVASCEKLKEKCVKLNDEQREVTKDTSTIAQSIQPITEKVAYLTHTEISEQDQLVQSDLVTMDWNTLMAEEENVLESEVAQIKQSTDETDASQTNTQVATEVTILPEISNIMDMEPKSEQRLENAQMKEIVQNEMNTTSSPNEQNNNDKIFSSDLLKNSPLNIVEEITRYEPIVQDTETRTIYLITHEEKKLPPIRTVKVFSTKNNSLEIETQGESTSDTIHTFLDKDIKIIDKNISRSTSENVEDVIEGQISTDCIEEFSQFAQDPNLNTEAEKHCLEQVYKVDPPHGFVVKPKSIDDEMIIGQEKLENVKNLSNICRAILTTNEGEGDNYLHLDEKDDNIVDRVSNQMEEFSENILEHAIFGSVQDRRRLTFVKTSSIPYQELVEEIKTYSLNLDIDQLDFDYHKLMIDEEGEDSLDVDNKTDVVKQCLDEETTNNDLDKKDSMESYYEKSAKETAASSLNMSDAPHFNYYELKDAEKSFASLMSTLTDLKFQDEENKNIDQNLSNLLQTFAVDAVLKKNDCLDNVGSIIKENKPSDITSIPFSEINNADHAVTNMEETHNSLFENTQAEDYKAVNLIESTNSKQIDVALDDSKFKERKMADNVMLNILHDDITYFNYSAIADAEKLLASSINRHEKTVSEEETYKNVFPIPSVNQNDCNLVSISNELDIQEENLKGSGYTNCDNEVLTTTPNIQNESELKAVILSEQNDIYTPKQTFTLLLENMRQEEPRYSHYDILNAEKIYHSLINVCDLNRNMAAPDDINAAVDTYTQIKDNTLVLHQESVDAREENIENVNYLKSSRDFLLGTSVSDMLYFEIPKYDYYERKKSEALLASVDQHTNVKNKVLLEEPESITDSDSHKKVIKMPSEDDSIQQSSENIAFNNILVQNYHEICDAENLYASNLIKSEDQYLTSVIDKNITSSGEDVISLTTANNDKQLLDIPVKTNTSNIKLNPTLEVNAENCAPRNTEEIEMEFQEISQINEFSKESMHEMTVVQPQKTYIDFCEPPSYNYIEIQEAECILARMATVVFITALKANKQQIDFTESSHDQSAVNDELKLNPEEDIELDVINKRMIEPEEPVLQEFSDSLVPVVFGDVSEISKMIVDKETVLIKSQKKDLDGTHKDTTTVALIEDPVEDFVIVENVQNINTIDHETDSAQKFDKDQNTPEALDFEHSFEVIDIEKDISCEMKCLDGQPILTGKSEISSITVENDASSSNKTVQVDSRKEDVQERAESPKPENTSQTIASKMTETDISSSVCMTQSNTDMKDTHGQSSNVTSTGPYVDTSTDVSSDLVSDQSVLTETVSNNNTRPEKSPIHSLHDLLPEIDSIPEFKPSFSNTILFSKLSADAPEFTPSYMYQTGDNQFISDRESECKQINTPILSLSNTQQLLQTDEPQAGFTAVPVTYSSVVLSQKEKVESADISKEHLSKISESIKTDDSNIGENVDNKSKRNKKKKKKEDKKEDTVVKSLDDVDNVPASDDHTHLSDKINIWSKAKDDGKSYAAVLAEGLDERRECLQNEQNIDQLYVKDQGELVLDKPESLEKDIEFITIASPTEIENYEICGSWAKVVASNRPSPERTQKDIIHSHENKVITKQSKAPVILVDESDSEHHKPEVEIDAEGFITVDRSRRSRSRSRDDRLTNVSKTYKKNDAREQSENRFNALTCTLKLDDCEPVQSSHSDEERELTKKERKSRSSKSREKEVKVKLVESAAGITDDYKQPVKKDKRKRSSKSKEKINRQVETFEMTEALKQIEAESIDVKKEVQQIIQPLQEEAVESKKKAKKKKKEKKLIKETNDAPSPIEITSSEQESSEQKHYTVTKCIETPISTPESLQTPVKDRFYSEVQYWKVDPNTLNDSSTLSEILTVEVENNTKLGHPNLVTEGQLKENNEVNKSSLINIEILDKGFTDMPTEVSSLTTETSNENITDEQSLENKMADLQREIEEMLLPENDASVTSEGIPKELADTQISLDEQHDEIFENITPSFASPEPEEIYPQNQVLEFTSTLTDHEISTKVTPVANHNNFSDVTVTVAADKEKPADKHVEGVNSLTTNISPTITTNNITDLKLDNFWVSKSIADDAEKTFVRQTLLNLNSYVPSEEMVQFKPDTNSEQLLSDDNKILNNLITDTFWPEKHLYHDAECEYFSQIAQKTKFKFISNADIEVTDKRDKDKDPGGGSSHSSDVDEPRESSGSPFDSNYISMDLPGGICSWKDHSSYLSLETPTDSLTGIVSESTPLLGTDIPEDKLTNLSLEPDASFPPVQEPAPGEDENRMTAKDDLSNSLEILLEEVKIVQAQLSDLPNETLDAMEAGLKEGIAVLVKCEEAAILLEQKIMEFNQEVEVQALQKELIVMKARISKLLIQTRQGLHTIKDARIEIENQSKQIEEQKEQIGKLDSWLDAINTELKESAKDTDVLTEADIIRFIEIYERYLKEYENYEIILRSITVISHDESSQSMQMKINALKKALEESKHLVISEIERLRQILLNMKFTPEVVEEEISQTDRTIDSTSMPEEVASSEEIKPIGLVPTETSIGTSIVPDRPTSLETEDRIFVDTKVEVKMAPNIEEVKNTVVKESQTGKSLISDPPSMHDKSIICQPQIIETHDVSLTCAPPQDVEVQTSEPKSPEEEFLENIQVTQNISDGHETIVISSKPVVRDQHVDDHSLLVDADYRDDHLRKNSQLNITHSLPQAFETVMVEPDETTTEVVVDADGTKRIIVKKIRKTLVTRQQTVQMKPHDSQIMSGEEGTLQERSFQQIILKEDKGSSSTTLGDGRIQNIQYQTYGGQVITGLPGREMTIQEITSKPEMVISMEKGMSPDQILQVAEGEVQPHVQTSSSSVTAVVEQVTKRIIKTRRRIIRRVVIIDGKEHVSEEIVEEPDTVEVLEEQIPKVSINVKESNIPIEKDDSSDRDKQPPQLTCDSNEKSLKDKTQHGKCTDKSDDLPEEVMTTTSRNLQSLTKQNDPEDSDANQEYIQSRLRASERTTVPISTCLTPENICLEPQQCEFEQIDSQSKKSAMLTGEQFTQSEAISSHFASVTQTVTRKITRTRKRIIKHIEIIDGKENITEEIIEEPDDVEIIEEEPKITHQCLDQDIKIKKFKIIRQVQMIDGKEHVTEQMIEESDDADNSEPQITTKSSTDVCDKDKPIELEQDAIIMMKNVPEDLIAMTNRLISSETDHTIATKTLPVKSLEQSVKSEMQNNELLKCTKDVKDKKDENIPEINIPVSTSHKIEDISKVKEIDQKLVTVHLGNKTEVPQSLYLTLAETEKTGRNDDLTVDTTQKLSNANEKEEALNLDKSFRKTDEIASLPSTSHQHEIQPGDPTRESSTNLSDDIEKTKPETISAAVFLQGNNTDIMTSKPTTKIIKTRTRVIKHIQIIDGKEHVKEEIVEEPEEVELFLNDPKTYVVQEEGIKTKRLRIIRNIQIIDGKEHVTEKVLEDPDCEYMPDSTVTANIDLHVSQSTKPHLDSNIINKNEPDPQRRLLEGTVLTTDQQKGISSIDISKSFIDREIDHAEIVRKPSFSNNEQTEKDEILVAKSPIDINKEITSQPEVNPEITKEIPSSRIEKTTSPEVSSKEEQQTAEIQYTSSMITSPVCSSQKTVIMDVEDNSPKDDKTVVLEEPKESTSSNAATSKHERLSTQNKNASKDESQKATLMDITKSLLSSEIGHTAMVNRFKSEGEESKVKSDKDLILETSQNKTETTSDLTETVISSGHIIQAKHDPGNEEETVTNKIILTHSEIGNLDLIYIPKDHKPGLNVELSQIKSKHDMTSEKSKLDHVIIKEDNTSVKQPFEHLTTIPKEMQLTQINTPESVTYSDLGQLQSEVTLKETQRADLQTPNAKCIKEIDLTFSESGPDTVNESIKNPDNVDVTHDQDVKSTLINIVKPADSIDDQEIITEHIKRKEDNDCLPESTIATQIDVSISKPDALAEDKLMNDTSKGVNAKADKSLLDITKELISKETDHTSQFSPSQKQCLHKTKQLEETKENKIYSEKIDPNTRSSQLGSANLSDINNPLSKFSKNIKSSSTSDSAHIDLPIQDFSPFIDSVVIDRKFDSSTKTETEEEEPLNQNTPFNKEQPTGHIIVDKAITQSSVGVQPHYAESIVPESHSAAQPTMSDLSYTKQLDPRTLLYDDTNILESTLVPNNETISKSDQTPISNAKHKVIAFIEQERNDTHLSNLSAFEKGQGTQTADSKAMLPKTIDINMSIEKTDTGRKIVPNIQLNLKVEDYESQNPFVAKKDVDISLPAEIKITNEPRNECSAKENLSTDALTVQSICADLLPEEKEKVRKKSKKNKKQKRVSECSDSFENDVHTDTDRTINDTESSSLGHYVELPVSPLIESPKPSKNQLQQSAVAKVEPAPSPVESESTAENKGYEPEDTSTCSNTEPGKKKRHKKRKAHGLSDDTIYPKQSSTEDDTLASTSIGTDEDTKKIKDADEKEKEDVIESNAISTDVVPINPVLGEIVISETISTSPKEESCQTISEASDLSTVKIVEECVGSSPEMVRTEIPTTVTYPIRVVEEVLTQEYSMQTSPEIINDSAIPQTESKIEPFTVKTTDSELQTSPTSVGNIYVQTMPKEDKEAHTQTVADNVIPDKVEVQDTQIQTSRSNSPDDVLQSEAITQVVPRDINYFEEKFSQTSSPITELRKEAEPLLELECREIQTSPTPQIQQDEKSTEIIIDTADSNIQTIKQENIDKETSTSPLRVKDSTEISVQTPHVSYVNVFTQSEEDISKIDAEQKSNEKMSHTSEYDSEKGEKVLIDNSQQTTPRSVDSIGLQIDNTQQTSPKLTRTSLQPQNAEITSISTDKIQQTSPRPCSENTIIDIKRELKTVDSMLQTSPLTYSDDSISTSTDDPYEIHLRAQISIPQVTDDFINIERQSQESAQSIIGDKSKQKKRRSKKKAESPLQSPGSLSDPINAELSLSVTPTSEDISSRQTDSVDEGISHIASHTLPTIHQLATQPKLTYSDVVQRSKSKSPSPSKSVLPSRKSEKARLIDSVEKRTQSIAEPQKNIEETMAVSLIEPSMEKSYALVVDKELNKLKQSVELNDTNKLEKSVIIVIETISIWLEEIQHKIQIETVTGTKVTDKSERLTDLLNYIRNLKQIIYVTEVNEEIITLIETLTRQVDAVNNLSNQSSVKVKEIEKEWNKFLEDTEILSLSIEKVKSRLDKIIVLELSVQQKLDELDEIETENIENTDIVRKMFRRFRSIVEANPKRECPTKLYTCDENTKQIENSVNTERDRLMQLMTLAEEYEQTLQDFGQITDVAEALLDGKIIVSDLDHLHEEIQKHRKFFVNLSHCRAILESLEDNLDSETRAKFSSLHNSLHDRATKIIDRAAGRAQQMTLAASRWSILDNSMKEEQQWLRVAHQRIPDLTNVTSMDHEQYINLYQSISLDVSHHYAKILRLLSIAESLQHLITCSGLESVCSIALDTLLTLQDDVDSRLTRLRAFKENWVTYEHLIDRVENWMKLANRELENITPENITTTPNLRRFWELKAQHEVHHNLKNESGIQFEKALEILPISDEMVQRQFFLKIEDIWQNLAARIDDLHTTAIQNISDRDVSSGEKLHILEEELRELRASLDGLKGVIKSEDELNLYIERLQVMSGRIDRIQNELGRLSLLPTAESDRLGALLSQSGILNDQIAEELERSLILKEKIMQVQAGIVRCQKNQRRARLTLEECESAERLGSDVVERASETCQRLLEDLATQWQDILTLRQALHTLPISLRVCVSPTGVERDISALQETHAEVEAACNDLCARLRAKLQLWKRYERQLELVQGAVREAEYMVELLTVQGQVDYDRLLKATEKLETLSESLSRRSGELVGELREAAAPLQASAEPAVAAQLRRELDDAAAAYEHTCTNLTQMCDKYQRAVELWRRYREAASTLRAFALAQEARLHALRPAHAPALARACLEQEARVAELRSLAAQVAAETGSRALQADADALARRLQLVAGAVQALADLGEARQLARAKAQNAKDKLCDMRQDLAPVEEDGEIVEHKLISLRDNLIALGKSEADIAPAKAQLPDIDRDVSEEHSIVRILELWQAMFRDTFLHYHRLSTALVRSGDAATAFKLWHEYLLDLQSFLSGSLPADYENLTEHRRLCRVHRNLLASQRSVLMNENKETNNRDLADKFDTLTNLHNETLARIVERHDEVCTRIAAWDDYREIYTELLGWLKEMEREKEKLQLRYVHIKRIHKILSKIQNLYDKLPEGRKFADKLSVYLKRVLAFTEETYGASVRMEYAGIVKRVDNLQASLDTWRDFLTRILGLIGEYESLTGNLHKLYSRTQDEVMSYSDEDRLSRPQIKKAIEKYSELRKKIDKTENQIEALSVIQEQLKECLSPQDIRIVNQKVWQMRQQRADLEHQLSIIIHRLQERLEIYTIFDSRLSRFSEWMTTLESRLESSSSSSEVSALDPQDLIRRINSEIQAETALKEREYEWLAQTGSSLIDLSKKDEKSYSKNTSKQLKDVQERWQKLQETGRSRIAKINELLETISQLEERLTEIRLKLHSIESKLSASVVIEHLTTKAVDEKFQDRDEIHKNIEDESSEVGETLNLCELVFNDPDVLKGNFDLRNLRTGVDIVEKKWKNICEMSEQRKNALKEIRKSAELANSLLPKVEKKLDSIEKRVEKVEIRKQRGESDDDSVSKAVIKDLDALEEDVKRLEDAYGRIASARGIEMRGEGADHTGRLRAAVRRWQQLRVRVNAVGTDLQRQFVAAHGKAVVALAEADVRLTRALHLAPTPLDLEATFKELDGVEQEVRECEALVKEADRLEAALGGVGGTDALASEYRTLLADVTTRLQLARQSIVADVDTAVQVDTLKWETDAALQVDTLTSKETYRVELAAAVKETSESLEALRTALMHELKDNASGDELATAAKEIAKAGAKPGQTLELAKHLSELLLTECDATEEEAMLKEVESLSMRYEDLLTQAKKRELQINNLRLPHSASYALTCEHESGRLTCPLCSDRNWKQLDNDLWRLEQWLQFAEATDEARTDPPEQYDALEDAIQDHREFLLDLDSHKALVVSLNVVGAHVARHARSAAAGERARARLAAANARWDAACARAADWQRRLQRALVHNQQFHDIVVELVSQLAAAERSVRAREPLRLRRPADELRRDFRRFSELRDELARAEPRVQALRDAAALLQGLDSQDVCRRLGELRLRLQSLRKLAGVYALKLGAALARHPAAGLAAVAAAAAPQLLEEEEEQMSSLNLPPLDESDVALSEENEEHSLGRVQRGLRFVCRVARASLPFQALLLLLLGAAALVPHAHSDCRPPGLALEPVLRYPDGPPPL